MCLKPPNPSNEKIFQEAANFYEYEANNNLIQGYSTTSYLGAYEKKTGKNGLYVEHLKRYLTKDKDLPIVEILQKVAKGIFAFFIVITFYLLWFLILTFNKEGAIVSKIIGLMFCFNHLTRLDFLIIPEVKRM